MTETYLLDGVCFLQVGGKGDRTCLGSSFVVGVSVFMARFPARRMTIMHFENKQSLSSINSKDRHGTEKYCGIEIGMSHHLSASLAWP